MAAPTSVLDGQLPQPSAPFDLSGPGAFPFPSSIGSTSSYNLGPGQADTRMMDPTSGVGSSGIGPSQYVRFPQDRPMTVTINGNSNETLPYHYWLKRHNRALEHILDEGQLIFGRKQAPHEMGQRKEYIKLNLVQINHLLASGDQRTERPGDSAIDAWWILDHWFVDGVARNQEDNQGVTRVSKKILNVVAGGRATALNVFGATFEHQPLWLVLKRVPRVELAELWALTGDGSATSIETVTQDSVWQFVPWTQPGADFVPPEVTDYVDDWGVWHKGVAIRVGYAHHGGPTVLASELRQAASSVTKMINLPQLEMHVAIGAPEY